MSEFNMYTLYSQSVSQELKTGDDIEKVMDMVEDFNNLTTYEKAKQYIADKMKIRDQIQNFPLGGNSRLNIKENPNFYVVSIKAENKNFCFSYKKNNQ